MATVETTSSVAASAVGGWRRKVSAYVSLTKPRIIELLLVTTVPVMFLAQGGVPDLWLVLATFVGGTLSAGGANAFNCWYDRDIDAKMHRTSARPLVTGEVSPRAAVVFASALTVLSTLWLWVLVNPAASVLALSGLVLYVVGYTMLLKRRTTQNIVWGGAAGCMPVLVGWAAVTGDVGWPAILLFLVVFLWTPPHYWPLSMRFKEDYAAAEVPMLPVRADIVVVARQVVVYSWGMLAASLALVPVAGMGWIYTVAAVVSGGMFVAEAHRLVRAAKAGAAQRVLRPMRLFHFSITYITVLFLAVAIDPLLHLSLR